MHDTTALLIEVGGLLLGLIGGMTTGIFTPTEGAIAACLWAMVLGFGWYRPWQWPASSPCPYL